MSDYAAFIETKTISRLNQGFEVSESDLHPDLFPFQKYVIKKALAAATFAVWADCGLGKTFMQLEWSRQVTKHTNKPVLILAPLAVVGQTIKEGQHFNIPIADCPFGFEYGTSVNIHITNYEQIQNIDCSIYGGIALDESSILKNYTGAYRNLIIETFANVKFKSAWTATPSPNDELELGNHAEFLNICTSQDMRAQYFTTDKSIAKGEKFRLKKHATKSFYQWISTWAIMFSKPSDIGYDDAGYDLPPLNLIENKLITPKRDNGQLYNSTAVSATNFNGELRLTKFERLSEVVNIVNSKPDESFIIWIKHNEEGEELKRLLPHAVEVKGSDNPDYKKKMLLGFANNEFPILISKTKIAALGMNYQNCHNQIFASLDFSFEALYQAIRRSYRFGQLHPVNIYLITLDTMQNVIEAIQEKQKKFETMQNYMRKAMNNTLPTTTLEHKTNKVVDKDFTCILGDAIEESKNIPDESIGYTFFSPPFGALYVFSDNPKDMSNVRSHDEFFQHFSFLVPELLRVTKPGRLVSLHIMQGTTLLGRDGFYSIVDFRGDIIRLFTGDEAAEFYKVIVRVEKRLREAESYQDFSRADRLQLILDNMMLELQLFKPKEGGFHFHAEHMIRKDPKTAAIRTKNRQLMWGTTKKDSSIVRPGLADYILTFRKPGENKEPIKNNIPFDLWCQMAEPVWIDVQEGDTLEFRSAKANDDERHLTPTQLKPIDWCSQMYSNKGDTCFVPFGGIGSEAYQWLKMGRKAILIELKESYFNVAVKNCNNAVYSQNQLTLY